MRLYFSLLGYFRTLAKVKYEAGEETIEARTSAVPMISYLKPNFVCLVAPNSLATYFHTMDSYLQKISENSNYETIEDLLKEAIKNYTDSEGVRVYESIEKFTKIFGTKIDLVVSLSEGKYTSNDKNDKNYKKLKVITNVNPNVQKYHLYYKIWEKIRVWVNDFISNPKEDSLEFILDVTHGQNYFVIELVQVVQDIATIIASFSKSQGKKVSFRVTSYSPAIPPDPSGEPLKFVEIQNVVLSDQVRSFDYFSLKKVNTEFLEKLFHEQKRKVIIDLIQKLSKIPLSLSFGFFLHLVDYFFEIKQFEESEESVYELISYIFKQIENNIEVKIDSLQDSVEIILRQANLELCDGFYDILKTMVTLDILKHLINRNSTKQTILEYEQYENTLEKQLKRLSLQTQRNTKKSTRRFYKFEDLERISKTIWRDKAGLKDLIDAQIYSMKKGIKSSKGFYSSMKNAKFNEELLFESSYNGEKHNLTRNFIAHCGIVHKGFFFVKLGSQSSFEIYISPNHSVSEDIFSKISI